MYAHENLCVSEIMLLAVWKRGSCAAKKIPRDRGHLSIPVEMGFYYAGQPNLQVAFTGSACDPNYPASEGCESVDQDAGFQQNLAAFKARNNHNLSYASFFPIFSIGFAYRFR